MLHANRSGMRILFIGGTGNLSAECAALLHRRGHEIHVISRGTSVIPGGYRTVVADYRNPESMRAALDGVAVDVVINFLGYELNDVIADHALFHGSIRQYVFISSASVYEKPASVLPITEESPLGNVWWDYARKKEACEHWLMERWNGGQFPVTIVRPSHTYSNRWIPNPVSSASYTFASRLERGLPVFVPDDGESLWTLTAASDFAVGLCGLVGNEVALGEAFHITSDEALTWNRIVAEIAAALDVDSPDVAKVPVDFICRHAPSLTGTLKGDKAHCGVFDNSKIKRLVPEFHCRKSFHDGIRESVAWLRAHPEFQNPNPQVDVMCDAVIHAWRAEENSGDKERS